MTTREYHRVLEEELVGGYRRQGWTRISQLLDALDLETVRRCYAAAEARGLPRLRGETEADTEEGRRFAYQGSDGYKMMFHRNYDLRLHFEELRPIVRKVADIASQLLGGREVRILWDTTFTKPTQSEGTKATVWHQDLPYVPVDRRGFMTIWMPMADVTEQAGALKFVSGSHRLGPIGRVDFTGPEPSLEEIVPKEDLSLLQAPTTVPLLAGDATVHDGLTLHGAGPNQSSEPRRVWACVFIPADTLWTGAPFSNKNLDSYTLTPFKPFNEPDLIP